MGKKQTAAKPPKADDQVGAFRKAARELGCEDNEERFRDALRRVAQHKPEPQSARRRKGA